MTNKSGRIGTAAETGVTRYLAANGFPHAERRRLRGTLDGGDIVTVPGLVVEVKGGAAAKTASVELIGEWLAETEVERLNAGASLGLLVVQRRGYAPARAGMWRAIMPMKWWLHLHGIGCASAISDARMESHLSVAVLALRAAGYGDPLEATA